MEECLCSLIAQLSSGYSLSSLAKLYESCEKGFRRPSVAMLRETLRAAVEELQGAYLVLDALDECQEFSDLLNTIRHIASWGLGSLRVLLTSRRERLIEEHMEALRSAEVCLQTHRENTDIALFIKRCLTTEGRFRRWSHNEAAKREIGEILTQESQGMYVLFHVL